MPCDRTWPTRAAPLVQTCLDVLHCTSDFRAVMRPAAGLNRTRWAPPDFLPPTSSTALYLVNLEELPSGVPMVQAALFQLVRDRKCGEYELPEGASLMACGNRESDRGVTHRMPTPLASRFVHLEIKVDVPDWCAWAAGHGIAPEVLFYIQMRPEMLHQFDPQSREAAFACPRTWEFVSNVVNQRGSLDPAAERALFRGSVGEAAAVEFSAFLKVWRELPHPKAVIDDPENALVPENASALIALCGSLSRRRGSAPGARARAGRSGRISRSASRGRGARPRTTTERRSTASASG